MKEPGADIKTKPVYPMPRSSMAGLLITMVACYLPHMSRLSWWMSLYAITCIGWRLLVHWEKAKFPPLIVKLLVAVLGTYQLIREHGTLMSPDGGVAFLLLAYFAKLLEMHYRRDAFVLMLLSFFVIPMQFLYDNSLAASLWVFICNLMIVGTLVSFHQQSQEAYSVTPLVKSLRLVIFAFPVTIALFLFFPRLQPFWSLPSSKATQSVGMTDSIDTETLDSLFKSREIAFRVEFEGTTVSKKNLYWRGVAMENFDGKVWNTRQNAEERSLRRTESTNEINYKIYLQPTQQKYLFGLTNVTELSGTNATRKDNGMLSLNEPIISQTLYRVRSRLVESNIDSAETTALLKLNTRLPARAAPNTRVLAEVLFAAAGKDPDQLVRDLGQWIFKNEFSYTLDPPALAGDRVDDFLFRTRSGYCSHYASAVAVLLRSVGIPARVIGGYQGGEFQEAGKYWMVHQYDAHAWIEYWSPASGWTLFDPTAAISPDRIEQGMEGMTAEAGGAFFGAYAIDQWPVIRQLRHSVDYLNYQWIAKVVSYQSHQQTSLMNEWFGGAELRDWLPWLVGTVTAGGLLVMIVVYWRERPPPLHKLDGAMLKVLTRLNRRFRPRRASETISQYCEAYAKTGASNAATLLNLCDQYHRLRFQPPNNISSSATGKTVDSISGKLHGPARSFIVAARKFK